MSWQSILKRFDDKKDIKDEEGNVIGQVGSAPHSSEYQDNQTPVQKIIQGIKDSGLPIPDLSKVHQLEIGKEILHGGASERRIYQRAPITGQLEETPETWAAFPGTKGPDMNIYDMTETEKYNALYKEVIMKPMLATLSDNPFAEIEVKNPELVGFTRENFHEAIKQLKRPSVTRHSPGHR